MKRFLLLGTSSLYKKTAFTLLCLLTVALVQAATYYYGGSGSANSTNSWWINANGTGAHPPNFTTTGDIFIIQTGQTASTGGSWTIGSGVTLQIQSTGILSITGNGADVTINGTIAFLGTSSNQVSLAGSGNGNSLIVYGILKTANTNGVQCTSCSTPINEFKKTITLDPGSSYEFNGVGSTQTTVGLPAKVKNLTINNPSGTVNLSADVEATGGVTITAGTLDVTASNRSINVSGGDWSSSGTLNPRAGTVTFSGSTAQSVGAGPYYNLTFTGTGTKTTTAGTRTIGGTWNVSSPTLLNTNNTVINLTGDLTGNGSLTQGSGLITIGGSWNRPGGSFTAGSGGVTLTGSGKSILGGAGLTFNTLTVNGTYTNNQTGASSLTVNTALTGTGALTQAANANLNLKGTADIATLTAANTGNTVTYNGTADQTIKGADYYNLATSTGGVKALGGATTVANTFNVGTSSTFKFAGNDFTANGPTTIDGTLNIVSTSGIKTFNGNVTVNGTWKEDAAADVSFGGNLTNNGTFTASTGIHNFTGTGKTISSTGALTIPAVNVTGTYTNSGTLNVSAALTGAGTLTQAANANLNIGGTATIGTLTATATGNTVNYNGSVDQNVKATTYYNLTLSGSQSKSLPATITVSNDFTTSGTLTAIAGTSLTVKNVTLGSGTKFTAGSSTINVSGNWANNTTTTDFAEGTSTIIFNGGNQTITGTVGSFYNLELSGTGTKTLPTNALLVRGNFTTSGTATATAGGALTITGNVNIGANTTFNAGDFTHRVAGNWTKSGTFNAGAGNIIFNAVAPASQTIGASNFNNIEFQNGGAKTASGALAIGGSVTIAGGSNFNGGTLTHTVGGDWKQNGTFTSTGTIDLNSSGEQHISALTTFNNLKISNPGNTILDGVQTPGGSIAGDLTVNGGTLDLQQYRLDRTSAGGTLTIADGATIKTQGNTFLANYSTYSLAPTSTVNYYAAAPIVQAIAAIDYGNLVLSGGGIKNLPATGSLTPPIPDITIKGDMTIMDAGTEVKTNADYTVMGSLSIGTGTTLVGDTKTVNLKGNWINNGTFTEQVSKVWFNGTAAQTIGGSTATTFYKLQIDNAAGVSITTNESIEYALTLTNGILSIPTSNTLTLQFPLTIDGAEFSNTTHIATLVDRTTGAKGILQVNGLTTTYTFPTGDGTYYLPVTVTPAYGSTSNFTVTAFSGITNNGQPNGTPLTDLGKRTLVDAVWNIQNISGLINSNIKLGWPNALEGATFTLTDDPDQGIAQYTSGAWDAFQGIPDGNDQTATRLNLSSFGPFAVGIVGGNIILPVKFANVKAVATPAGNVISWSNLTESDVVSYEVERSTNGRNFNAIATLAPTQNNYGKADYSSLDKEPGNGSNFYRIKVTEGTGKVTYSIVLALNAHASGKAVGVVPNPVVGGQATLQLTNIAAGKYAVNIYGTSGQLITSKTITHNGGSASESLDMSNVQPGAYMIEVKGAGLRFTQHIIKR